MRVGVILKNYQEKLSVEIIISVNLRLRRTKIRIVVECYDIQNKFSFSVSNRYVLFHLLSEMVHSGKFWGYRWEFGN